MIYVSLGDADLPEMRVWFDRAVSAQPDFAWAWRDMRWGLRPRWYGNEESMLAFGLTALNTGHFETDVPMEYYRAVTDVESEEVLAVGEHVFGREDIWPHLQAMYEGYIKEASWTGPETDLKSWRSSYAAVAYLGAKYDVAAKQLEALNWQPSPASLAGWGKDIFEMPLEVAARTGAAGQTVSAAESARKSGDPARAASLYAQLDAAPEVDDRTKEFVRNRLAELGIQQQLDSGKWVDFMPASTNFAGWRAPLGDWSLTAAGVLEVRTDGTGHLLYCEANVGTDFEIRGKIESSGSPAESFRGGIVFGLPDSDSSTWYGYRLAGNSQSGTATEFSAGWSGRQVRNPFKLSTGTNEFYLRFVNGRLSGSINNEPVVGSPAPPRGVNFSTNEVHIGFGSPGEDGDQRDLRYLSFQVRKL
jgi:hypothetical protein